LIDTTADNLTPTTVDRAVRDVLAEMNGRHAGGNGAAASPGQTSPATALLGKSAVAPGTLVIDDAVVTLASLDGRLDGVNRVVASSTAVVTPAVRDELRERGITLERGESGGQLATATQRKLVFASAKGRCDTDAIARALRATGVELETIECSGMANTVGELACRIAGEGVMCVVATSRPAAAACVANRHTGVRAAAVASVDDVDRAISEVGANLLAIDVVGTSTHVLRMAVRRFAELSPCNCPAEFAACLS
jgi:hypothetical protein